MQLTAPENEFAGKWVQEHLSAQPEEYKSSLTYYVSANFLYRAYLSAAHAASVRALDFNGLYAVLKLMVPGLGTGRISGQPVYLGIRYYSDKMKSQLRFGV